MTPMVFTLSCQDLISIVLFLAIDRQTVIIVLHSCTCTLAAAVFIRGGPAKPTYNRPNCNFLIAFECIDKIQ